MGIPKIGVTIISPVVEKWVQKAGVRSVLQAKAPSLHGINPTLTYAPTGKTFALPRFCTQEMKQAREMNKIAARQIKSQELERTYPKASPQDLKRLTSETIEDSYSRVEWTNPKDGKVYNLLKQGKTDDGKFIVRILDSEGAFIKEAELTPRKIMIYDSENTPVDFGKFYEKMSHGESVKRFVQRANPFADIEFINVDHKRSKNTIFNILLNLQDELKMLHQRITAGEKVDYISLSLGLNHNIIRPDTILQKSGKTLSEFKTTSEDFLTSQFLRLHPNVRILQAAGNSGKDVISPDLMFKGVEGVGALDRSGKVAEFSSTRNSLLTQHYEQGVFRKTPTKYGLGFFDNHSTDLPISPEFLERAQSYLGKKPREIGNELYQKTTELKNIARKKYKAELARVRKQLVSPEEEAKLDELRTAMSQEKNALQKKIKSDEYWEYSRKLYQRTEKALAGYENPEGIEYKRFADYAEKNGLVRYSSFGHGEYTTFERTPYLSDFDTMNFVKDSDGNLILAGITRVFPLQGTSFSTPIRTAKLALNEMMENII